MKYQYCTRTFRPYDWPKHKFSLVVFTFRLGIANFESVIIHCSFTLQNLLSLFISHFSFPKDFKKLIQSSCHYFKMPLRPPSHWLIHLQWSNLALYLYNRRQSRADRKALLERNRILEQELALLKLTGGTKDTSESQVSASALNSTIRHVDSGPSELLRWMFSMAFIWPSSFVSF